MFTEKRIIIAAMLVLTITAIPLCVGDTGALWTTTTTMDPQDVNHYKAGDTVWIRGSNFGGSPLLLVIFRVNDPNNPVWTSGEITPTNGNIFEHWPIPTGTKAGEYKVEARDFVTGKKIKSDNFQISAVLVTPEMPFGTLGTIIILLVGLALFAARGPALNAPLRKIMPG